MEQLEQIEQLLSVFDERETLMNLCNRKVATILTPTVLGALFELINLPHESVVWEDFQVMESVLVIRASITYDPAHELSPFLNLVVPPREGATPIRIQKTIQFGVPLTKAFEEKNGLKAWFMEVIMNGDGERINAPPEAAAPEEDDHSELNLTKEQVAQMLYFQKMHGSETQ